MTLTNSLHGLGHKLQGPSHCTNQWWWNSSAYRLVHIRWL